MPPRRQQLPESGRPTGPGSRDGRAAGLAGHAATDAGVDGCQCRLVIDDVVQRGQHVGHAAADGGVSRRAAGPPTEGPLAQNTAQPPDHRWGLRPLNRPRFLRALAWLCRTDSGLIPSSLAISAAPKPSMIQAMTWRCLGGSVCNAASTRRASSLSSAARAADTGTGASGGVACGVSRRAARRAAVSSLTATRRIHARGARITSQSSNALTNVTCAISAASSSLAPLAIMNLISFLCSARKNVANSTSRSPPEPAGNAPASGPTVTATTLPPVGQYRIPDGTLPQLRTGATDGGVAY